ncbi:MAG: hypothetical protein IID45_02230 [Planctomycetes bacterium]|nr:hypothetical protein [Planctomycetota bacterium]
MVFGTILVAFLFPPQLQGAAQKAVVEPIPLSRIQSSSIMGKLGKPLGKILLIEGIAAKGDIIRKTIDSGPIVLRIRRVNGRQLRREVIYPCAKFLTANVKTPRAGVAFSYIGHEDGGFVGVPVGTFKYVNPVATTSRYFRTSFTVLKNASRNKFGRRQSP